jgi:hypothetical protein
VQWFQPGNGLDLDKNNPFNDQVHLLTRNQPSLEFHVDLLFCLEAESSGLCLERECPVVDDLLEARAKFAVNGYSASQAL